MYIKGASEYKNLVNTILEERYFLYIVLAFRLYVL